MTSSRLLLVGLALVLSVGCRDLSEQVVNRAIELVIDEPNVEETLAKLHESHQPCHRSESIGRPWKGALHCGRLLQPHPRLKQTTVNQFGTTETVGALHEVADRLVAIDPNGPPLQVMDLSGPQGGPIDGHRSHQSGRDVDLRYFYRGRRQPHRGFHHLPIKRIDARRTWLLVDALMKTKRIERIFMDREIQAVVHAAAQANGTPGARLRRLFQFPRNTKKRVGVIRHWPNHFSHLHVRFRCPRGSSWCR